MYLYGASGHAKVIMDILRATGVRVEGLIEDNPQLTELLGYPVCHYDENLGPVIVSIGNNLLRRQIVEKLHVDFGTAIHPSAVVSPFAIVGEGTVVMQGAIIQSCAQIGKHCIINTGASVDHDCRVGNYAHISPHATLCGNVMVGEGTQICSGAVIIPGVQVGNWTVVGAGAVVIRDLPDHVVAVGNPCRIIKTNLI